jgi:hypothetical protein
MRILRSVAAAKGPDKPDDFSALLKTLLQERKIDKMGKERVSCND